MALKEKDIVVPALLAMLDSPNGEIQTSDLINKIRQIFNLDADDLTFLDNRTDQKFTQIVRNLKSHKTLANMNLAEEIEGGFRITPTGVDWLEANGFIGD